MDENELKQKYDGVGISELLNMAVSAYRAAREAQKQFYEILEYMRMTNRFKEEQRYRKASFWQVLEDLFNLRQGTYRENVRAFMKFPDQAVEYGPGLVAKVERTCGIGKMKQVFQEIEKESGQRKKKLSRAKIEGIINRYKVEKVKKEITDWKAMYEREKASHDKTRDALKEAMARVHELEDQIARLKRTAESFSNIRAIFDQHNQLAPTEARA